MSPLTKTYNLVTPPEPPMPWSDYEARFVGEWNALLSSTCEESAYQTFFEKHPSFLPWIHGTFLVGHHGLFPSAVISQPILSGIASKRPDFLMIASDSECLYAVMIEIESPCKSWFTARGQASADLTQAINQLKEWQVWFDNPLNVARFIEDYKIPEVMRINHVFEQRYILIYGRRSEIISSSNNKKRAKLKGANEEFMTYDRLSPNIYLSDCLCVMC
jgi:hypothetical protein